MRTLCCLVLTGCLCDVQLAEDPPEALAGPLSCPDRVVRLMSVATTMCFANQGEAGKRIFQTWCALEPDQRFVRSFIDNGCDRFVLRAEAEDLCVGVPGGRTDVIRYPVHLGVCDAEDAQLWVRDERLIRRSGTELCLDVPSGDARAGNILQQHPCHGGDNQQFVLLPAD